MSLAPRRPPGRRTRAISRKTRGLSVERLITQFETTTSTLSAGSGIASISPFRKRTLVARALAALVRASSSISSVMSRPYASPVGPTRLAESSTSMPPPEPRSRTTSPSRTSAAAVGLPQPRLARTVSTGSLPRSSPYRLEPTALEQQDSPQQPLSARSASTAAAAYRARTSSRNWVASVPMDGSFHRCISMRVLPRKSKFVNKGEVDAMAKTTRAVREREEQVCLDARRHGVVLMRPFLRAYVLAAVGILLLELPWPVPVAAPVVLGIAAVLAFLAVWRWDRTRLIVT